MNNYTEEQKQIIKKACQDRANSLNAEGWIPALGEIKTNNPI